MECDRIDTDLGWLSCWNPALIHPCSILASQCSSQTPPKAGSLSLCSWLGCLLPELQRWIGTWSGGRVQCQPVCWDETQESCSQRRGAQEPHVGFGVRSQAGGSSREQLLLKLPENPSRRKVCAQLSLGTPSQGGEVMASVDKVFCSTIEAAFWAWFLKFVTLEEHWLLGCGHSQFLTHSEGC